MDFFNKLGQKASQTYKVTAEKTGKMAKEAKIKIKIGENKSNINDLYKEIGRKVYEKHNLKQTIDIEKDLEEECTKIDVLSEEIETLLNESRDLKDKKQCPKCFEEIEKNVQFCPKCGEKQEMKTECEQTENHEELKKDEILSDDETVKEVTDVEVGVATESASPDDSNAQVDIQNDDSEDNKDKE